MCPEPYGFFPYQGDCKKFIHCDNSIAHIKQCQGDLEYDPQHRVCTYPKGYCGTYVKEKYYYFFYIKIFWCQLIYDHGAKEACV